MVVSTQFLELYQYLINNKKQYSFILIAIFITLDIVYHSTCAISEGAEHAIMIVVTKMCPDEIPSARIMDTRTALWTMS